MNNQIINQISIISKFLPKTTTRNHLTIGNYKVEDISKVTKIVNVKNLSKKNN